MTKKLFSFVAILLGFTIITFAQTTAPTPTTPSISLKELITKDWKYIGFEEFGVLKPADSIVEKYDKISFTSDGLYTLIKKDVTSAGKWTLNETTRQLYCTDGVTGKQIMYTVKKCNTTILKLSYQSPDLSSTIYNYTVK